MVNTIMTFSEILYIWLGLTVVAAIAGSITHRLSPHQGEKAERPSLSETQRDSARPDPVQDHVHHLADEVVGQRQVTEQQPVLRGPEEQVKHHLLVDRGRDLAAGDGPVQHDPVLAA